MKKLIFVMAGLLLLGGCKSGKSESKNSISIVKGIESGADSVLVNHVIVNSMEAATPASLSASIHQLLRNQLKFKGIIMTDDLAMDAIRAAYGMKKRQLWRFMLVMILCSARILKLRYLWLCTQYKMDRFQKLKSINR